MVICSHLKIKYDFCSQCSSIQSDLLTTTTNSKKRLEVNPKKILSLMREEDKNIQLVENATYLGERARLIGRIKEAANCLRFKLKSIFLAVRILDKISITLGTSTDLDLHALASLITAVKYIEIDNDIPSTRSFKNAWKGCYFSCKEINAAEVEVLKRLNYILHIPTEIDFLTFYCGHGFLNDEQFDLRHTIKLIEIFLFRFLTSTFVTSTGQYSCQKRGHLRCFIENNKRIDEKRLR